jgi:hypothetical protein
MTAETKSQGTEFIAHGPFLPDGADGAELVHPEAQRFAGVLFVALAAVGIAVAPLATRAAPMEKGWWVEPITWPLFSLAIVLVAAGVQAAAWLRALPKSPERAAYLRNSFWAFGELTPAFEYSAYFCVYLFAVQYLGFALSSLLFLQFVVWRAGLRTLSWKLKAFGFVVAVILAFRVGIELWFPMAPIYQLMPSWFVNNIAVYL